MDFIQSVGEILETLGKSPTGIFIRLTVYAVGSYFVACTVFFIIFSYKIYNEKYFCKNFTGTTTDAVMPL